MDGFEERESTTRLNGADAVSFSIKKQSGANTAAIAERVHATLARVSPSFPALQIRQVHDDAEFIQQNVAQVREHIIFGGIMAVLVIFLFMRDWRSTLISALALPTSVIATFFFMWIAGFTFNMMTLMALSLVIGILIDDAVVVRENIYRHMEQGADPMTAAQRGTSEIGLAVMATTFTILAVFLPVGFMTGLVGQFFKSFALTIAFAVAMSLLVAFTLDPMLSSRFVRYIPPEERTKTRAGRLFERWGRAYDALDRRYHRVLALALGHPWKTLAAAALVFVASLGTMAIMDTEFVPAEDRGEFQVIVDLPPGTSFDESVARVATIETSVQSIPEVLQVFTTVGVNGQVRSSTLRVKTSKKDARERSIGAIKADVRARLDQMPFVDAKVADPEFMQGAPYEPPINVFVRGDDLQELQRITTEIEDRIRQIPGAVDVKSNLETGQPEVVARVNRDLAADLGFSVGNVAMQLRGMVEGIVPTKLRDGDREHDIRVRLAPEFRNDAAAILRTPLYAQGGAEVRAGDVVAFEPAVGPSNIDREQRRRQGEDRRRPGGRLCPRTGDRRGGTGDGRRADAGELRVGVCRRRRDDAGIGGGNGPGAHPGGGLHLHRARLAVRVVPRAVHHHAVAAARDCRRAAAAARHRQQHRHAGHDWRGDADGSGDEERDPARGLHEPPQARRGAERQGCAAQGGTGAPASDRDDDGGDGARDDAVGIRRR